MNIDSQLGFWSNLSKGLSSQILGKTSDITVPTKI